MVGRPPDPRWPTSRNSSPRAPTRNRSRGSMDPATGVYSCDDHLDLYAVPPEVWESRLPRAQAERGPRVATRDGKSVWVCEDRVMARSGMSLRSDVAKKLSAIGRAGIEDDGFRAGTPKLRLEDMDR